MRELPRPPRGTRHAAEAAAGAAVRALWALPLALTLSLGFSPPAPAEIYRWTDESGSVHFTDSLHGVPARYRQQVESRSDALPAPPARSEPEPSRAGSAAIPLERLDGGYLVRALINDLDTARLVLDTGATTTVLSAAAARRAGLTVHRDPPVVLRTANGQVEAGWAEARSIEVGGKRVGPLRVVVHDALAEADGLLGLNFLGAFRVEIHSQGPTLTLSPP